MARCWLWLLAVVEAAWAVQLEPHTLRDSYATRALRKGAERRGAERDDGSNYEWQGDDAGLNLSPFWMIIIVICVVLLLLVCIYSVCSHNNFFGLRDSGRVGVEDDGTPGLSGRSMRKLRLYEERERSVRSIIPDVWVPVREDPPFMRELDPDDEDRVLGLAPDPYQEPSTWHPFLRVITHQGMVVQVVDTVGAPSTRRRAPVVVQSSKPLGPPHVIDMHETVYFEVTFTRLSEQSQVRVGWATNRCPHDKHVGSVGVALGFSIGSGRIQFCGAPAKQFLKGSLRSGDTLGCGYERVSAFEAMKSGITNDISTVAMFFTLNGKLLGRPTQGLFHMRQADVRAVQELSVRSAGFYDGSRSTHDRMTLALGGAYATVSADGPCAMRFNFVGPFMWVAPAAEEVEKKHLAGVLGKDGSAADTTDMGQLLDEYDLQFGQSKEAKRRRKALMREKLRRAAAEARRRRKEAGEQGRWNKKQRKIISDATEQQRSRPPPAAPVRPPDGNTEAKGALEGGGESKADDTSESDSDGDDEEDDSEATSSDSGSSDASADSTTSRHKHREAVRRRRLAQEHRLRQPPPSGYATASGAPAWELARFEGDPVDSIHDAAAATGSALTATGEVRWLCPACGEPAVGALAEPCPACGDTNASPVERAGGLATQLKAARPSKLSPLPTAGGQPTRRLNPTTPLPPLRQAAPGGAGLHRRGDLDNGAGVAATGGVDDVEARARQALASRAGKTKKRAKAKKSRH